jgi:KUP system potassium uptake protein
LDHKNFTQKITPAGLLITLGIIFGDIGTSPLYVMKAIIGETAISKDLVMGAISCIFWTLTLQTTLKYVVLTLKADNKGEGGIFSLYALVRRRHEWLIYPAMIGGAALLADGIITPPISVSAAVEGLRLLPQFRNITTVPIVLVIISALFIFQQFGTNLLGKSFGPLMLIWFSMLGIIGFHEIFSDLTILKAVNPYYAVNLLANHPNGFILLGAVFLCTTGAEALYSDLGHCGRGNVRVSWVFVKLCLLLNYFGQGAYLLMHQGEFLKAEENPFYKMMPDWFIIPGIIIATVATIIASQSLISGSYTLISEAMRLNAWPKVKVIFPTIQRGQIYVPSINALLWVGCMGVTLYFRESSNMEAAYGLSITVTMLMTTVLLSYYLYLKRVPRWLIAGFLMVYLTIEPSFLIANLHKFTHGGWVTLLIGGGLFVIMWVWNKARKIRNRFLEFAKIENYLTLFSEVNKDEAIPKYATHLVYLSKANTTRDIETSIVYSMFRKKPKRADVYWLVHVDVQDEPHTMEYKIDTLIPGILIRVDFKLGFRVDQKINVLFRNAIEDMVKNKEIDIISRYESLKKHKMIGDFRFVVIEKALTYDNELSFMDKLTLFGYSILKEMSLSEEKAFGLDTSSITVEKVPLIVTTVKKFNLKRVD